MKRVIGVDIGGTRTRVGAVQDGQILARRVFPTRGLEEVREAIAQLLKEVGWDKPEAIGVGAPAPMDMRRGLILNAPNLPHWEGVNVVDGLKEAFQCPVFLGNDANCAALGELVYGWKARDFLYVTWSTGIGGGIVAGGQVVWGATGQAGEIGKELAQGEFPIQKGKPDVSQFGLSQFSASFDDAVETSFETYPIPVRISLGHSQKKLTVSKANLHAKLSFSPEDFLPGWGEGFPALRLDQKAGEIHEVKDNVHSKRWRGGLSMSR